MMMSVIRKTTAITSGHIEKDTLKLTSVCSNCNNVLEYGVKTCCECEYELIWDEQEEIEKYFREVGLKWKKLKK